MLRTELILHLTQNDCFPQDEYDVPGVAQNWKNAINGHEAYVPYDDELVLTTWGMVVRELCIDAPKNNGHDSDYDVWSSWFDDLMEDIKTDVKSREDDQTRLGEGEENNS